MKWCLGADRRNPERHGGAFIKGSMASVTPPQPPQGSTAGMTHLFIPGPGGGSGRKGEDRSGGRGEGAWAGPVTHARGDGWGKPQGDSAQSQTG